MIYPNTVVIHYQLTLNGFRRKRGYYLRCDIHVYSILSSFLSFTEKYFFLFSSSSIEYRKETFNVICRLSNLMAAKYRFTSLFGSLFQLSLTFGVSLTSFYRNMPLLPLWKYFIMLKVILENKLSNVRSHKWGPFWPTIFSRNWWK